MRTSWLTVAIVFQLVELLEALVGGSKLGRCRLELARFLFELARIYDQLRGLIQDLHHLVDVVHLFLSTDATMMRAGGGTDGAGS